MATDIRDLRIRIRSDEARRNLNEVEEGVNRIGGAATRVAASAATLGLALAGIAASAAVTWFIDTAKAIELMDAQLKTATGSADAAASKLVELQEFARQTPFDLEQAVTGFTKLTNLGLNPTIDAMTSFGNTAVAMGKSLEQFVEAVADAVGFEFERLKEFGIKTRQETDAIVFTFQGVTTEVERSAEAIEEYLTSIGNVQFAGAMEDAMTGITAAVAGFNFEIQRSSSLIVDVFTPAMESIINQVTGAIGVINNLGEATRDAFSETTNKRIVEVRQEIGLLNAEYEKITTEFAGRAAGGEVPAFATDRFGDLITKNRTRLAELNEELEYLTVAMRPIPRIFQQGEVAIEGFTPNAEDIDLINQFIDGIETTEKTTTRATRSIQRIDKEMQALLKTSMQLAGIREGLAADIGGTLADRLGQEISSGQVAEIEAKLEDMGETIGLDFASRFWDVFSAQGEFTLRDMVGTIQAWGLEIAQSEVFDKFFDDLKTGLGQELSNLIGGGLAGFGVGATAGGIAGGGPAGILAGVGGGALTGGLAGGGPIGAIVGGVLGGLGAALGGGGGGQNRYGFSIYGGLGGLRGAGGPGEGDFSRFISFVNELESAIAATFGPQRLAEMQRALEGFQSAEIRMAEGSFNAERALGLMTDRIETLVNAMGPGFLRIFQEMETGTAESTAAAVDSLIAVRQAMEAFNIKALDANNLLQEAAVYGESYAQTLSRIASAQASLEAAMYTAEERQQQTMSNAQQRIDEFNRSLGLTGDAAIDTREELIAYRDGLDETQQSQHAALLALLDVSDAFRLVFEAAEAATPPLEEVADSIDNLGQETFDLTDVIRDVVRLLNDYVSWNYRLAEAINATTGAMAGWELSLAQAYDTAALFNSVVAAGGPLDLQMQLFNQAFAQFQQAYNQAMQQIASDLQNRIAEIRDDYADLIDQEREAFDLRREALQTELDITRAWAGTLSSVEGIISGLQSGGLSPFGPTGQLALGESNLAALQAQYAGATGAQRAALGAQLAQALQSQLGLAQGVFGIGSNQYLEEYNDTITQLTAIQQEAAAEAARQSELEQALVDLQQEQTDRIAELNQQMADEILAAENHAQDQIDTVNQFAAGVYAEFERVGNQLYEAMLEQMRQQAEFERQGREIQAEQLQALLIIRDGFIAAGLVDPTAQARANARAARYL